ncbi:unnamed protein product, partial [Durusdinium trenchii]
RCDCILDDDTKETPLHRAVNLASHGSVPLGPLKVVLEALLAKHGDLQAQDSTGATPLHLAAFHGQVEPWISGSVIVNKVAFRDEQGEFYLDSASDLFESLKGCVVLDLYKTVIFPERLSSRDSIRLAKHRGEFQTIERGTLSFIFELQRNGFTFCACSFIGKAASGEYIEALIQSELAAVIPVIFVIYHRDQKASLAKELSAVAAIDDQREVVRQYRDSGIFAIEVRRDFGIATHKEEIIRQLRDQAGGQVDREVKPKGVPSGLVKDRK